MVLIGELLRGRRHRSARGADGGHCGGFPLIPLGPRCGLYGDRRLGALLGGLTLHGPGRGRLTSGGRAPTLRSALERLNQARGLQNADTLVDPRDDLARSASGFRQGRCGLIAREPGLALPSHEHDSIVILHRYRRQRHIGGQGSHDRGFRLLRRRRREAHCGPRGSQGVPRHVGLLIAVPVTGDHDEHGPAIESVGA